MKTIHFSTDSDTTVSASKDDVLYVLDRDANIAERRRCSGHASPQG